MLIAQRNPGMIINQPTQITLAQLFDAFPDGVSYMRAIRDDSGQLIDFVLEYTNPKIRHEVAGNYQLAVGTSLRYDNKHDPITTDQAFTMLSKVLETGVPAEQEQFNPILNQWLLIRRSPAGDGVLSITRIVTERRQAEVLLQQQTEQINERNDLLQGVLNTSLCTVFVYEAIRSETGQIQDFRVLLVNPQARQDTISHTGHDPVGNTLLGINPNSRQAGQFNLFCRVIETGQSVQTEQHYDTFNIWYNTAVAKLNDGVVVTGIDVSESRRTGMALERQLVDNRRQADLLNSILNSSMNGIMAMETIRDETGTILDFRFINVNEAAGKIIAKPVSEIENSTMLTLFPGNVETGLFAKYINTVQTGEPTRTSMHYKHDGLDHWFDISALKLGDGFVVTFTDMSVLKRAAQVVERSASELQTVIDTSQTGIFLFSPVRDASGNVTDFRFRVANQQLASYVGQQPEAVIGELGSTWFPGYQTNGLFEKYYKTYATGETQRFDFHYDTDGIDVWLDIMSTKVGDEVLVTFGDYTPMKVLQQQLEASVIDLQRSNKNLEQFAYVASHDLQEPLRKIQAFGDIIQTQYASVIGVEGADMIQRMQSAAARMQVLIKDVLAYSRIATKRETVEVVDLNQVLNDVLGDLETVISDKKAIITIPQLPRIAGDLSQLRQLFQNLISNALKFIKPGRTPQLVITAQPLRGRDGNLPQGVFIPVSEENRLFQLIELTDNGIGFDPHQAERIFQVFQRLHGRSEYQGTGIGLAIVKKVVENHQGYITAEGRPDAGATFRIVLPA